MSGSQAIAAEMTCQETVNFVMAEIQKWGTTVTFRVDDDADYAQFVKTRLDNQRRVHSLSLILWESSPSNTVVQNIGYSEILFKNYAQKIFPRCGGTGMINFTVEETGAIFSFAMSDENELGTEKCYEPTESIPPAISEIYRAWDWYCAYVL